MKKIRKEKLSLQKATIVELNNLQMLKINGGTDYNTSTDPDTDPDTGGTTGVATSNPRNTFTTCSSKSRAQ